jgi:hypothetical protein
MKALKKTVVAVSGSHLENNEMYSIDLSTSTGSMLRLTLDPRLALEIKDCLTALADEWLAQQATPIPNTSAKAFRKAHTVKVDVDVSKKTLLLEFDGNLPHRTGVAIQIDHAHVLRDAITARIREVQN